ncbi:MBL fold metallo-hydrolase [Motilibacter peucedani]|uniref:MBL fold metallo-hydrolase n=1 Tax=Motilibacter peucedani TaxID=598650 RepID=UPI001E522B95|nr:MBL fold metallo-hydrolase [Motilibacter peucedani]
MAVDPIDLPAVDEVVVTTLVDNTYDALLPSSAAVSRAQLRVGSAAAPQFLGGRTNVGLRAEHGFSALVEVRRGLLRTTVVFDAGVSPDGMRLNAERLGRDLRSAQAVVLSHGHHDHAGGLAGLMGRRGVRALPMVVHPHVWARRRLALPGSVDELPTLSSSALSAEGFTVLERRQASLLLEDTVLVTGEIDRTTEFERGMPAAHQEWADGRWQHDPLVVDDQALVVHVRGRGLLVITGCAHAGAVNIVRHARRLTGGLPLHALMGGLHLSGPAFESTITATVTALQAEEPDLVVAGHCTGWRAQHALAASLPGVWVPSSSGSSFTLSGC